MVAAHCMLAEFVLFFQSVKMETATVDCQAKKSKSGHHRPTSETPFEWHFAGGQMVAAHCMLAGIVLFFQSVPRWRRLQSICQRVNT